MSIHETKPAPQFVEGPIDGVVFRALEPHTDPRGWLVEVFRADELPAENRPAMAYVSQTLPGASRGPHEHVEQDDYFAILGPGDLILYLWDPRPNSPTQGHRIKRIVGQSSPQSVLVPAGVVHGYRNAGVVPAWVFSLPNRLYAGQGRQEPVDEIRHEERADSVYRMD
ncbi:MAG: dTDP-4-dehydrorhamnose 3,5-epimerase family protein [Pirellulales bacterium]|nr:dTDP-4-dehydrorhamnose 3,5-epimerase family protein [Pirellulales bacterium]